MFIGKQLIYLELQKTGGSHLRRLLERYVSGEFIGKHNRITFDTNGKYVIGSIRNPWDWYVSLWAYGVSGQGAIRARTTKGIDFKYYLGELAHNMGKPSASLREIVLSTCHDALKDTTQWTRLYDNSDDPALFQTWLQRLLDNKFKYDVGEGFAFSPVSSNHGLMTYRYLRLYTPGSSIYTRQTLTDLEDIKEFDRMNNFANKIIRMENLEQDFIDALSEAGIEISSSQLDEIRQHRNQKTNRSERKSVEHYYDKRTLDLVAQREAFLIEKYGYSPPNN